MSSGILQQALPRQTLPWGPLKYSRLIESVGILIVLAAPAWVSALFASANYPVTSSLLLVPVILFINFAIILHITHTDRWLRPTLVIALLFKVTAASAYTYLLFHVFPGGGDAIGYWNLAKDMARDFSARHDWSIFLIRMQSSVVFGTEVVAHLTGALVMLVGDELPTLIVFFAMVSFWGQYFIYRAFCTALPNGNRYFAALLLFFTPSLAFWPATIGKDAILGFCIGISIYGFTLLYATLSVRGILCFLGGVLAMFFVRPHIAAMVAGAVALAYVWGRNYKRASGMLMKILAAPVLALVVLYVGSMLGSAWDIRDFSSSVEFVNRVSQNTHSGGSAFGDVNAPLVQRIITAPFLLFRPFPWEVHNFTAAIASLEGILVAGLFWKRRHYLIAALRQWRTHALYSFIIGYAGIFTIVFAASMTNFGIVVRQRVMLLPCVLLLICGGERGFLRIPKLHRTRTNPAVRMVRRATSH